MSFNKYAPKSHSPLTPRDPLASTNPSSPPITRRTVLKASLSTFSALSSLSATPHPTTPTSPIPRTPHRIIVLGIDGMDHALTNSLIKQGKLPNLAAIASTGTFLPLQTSMPPLSPVAWSNFITGSNPGAHAVFDFLRRDPHRVGPNLLPEDALSKLVSNPSARDWPIPFTPYSWPPQQHPTLLRQGTPLWQVLENHNIPATIYKIPANFPVIPSKSQILSGMGTPDIEGSYGSFTFLSSHPDDSHKSLTGARLQKATLLNGLVRVNNSDPSILGPINPFLHPSHHPNSRQAQVPYQIHLDPTEKSAAICLQNQTVILKQGEWSPWLNVRFDLLPAFHSVHGLVRFYLQQASPHLRLYLSPVNLAPGAPGLASRALDKTLHHALGPFFTKGMPEETKALLQGVFSTDEFLEQTNLVLRQDLQALHFLLPRQQSGLLFFYLSVLDLSSHVLWRHHDPNHPHYDHSQSPLHASLITDLYCRLDSVVGFLRSQLRPDDALFIISDHGFAPVYHQFNLASWLAHQGYLVFKPASTHKTTKTYADVDWSNTRAYTLGFQSLYFNLKGREATGIVPPADLPILTNQLRDKLLSLQHLSIPVFRNIYTPADIYSGPHLANAPDLLLGYNRTFGPADDAVLGNVAPQVFTQNPRSFSANHANDPSVVPGVLFSSHKLLANHAKLEDLTVSIINFFGLPAPKQMTGSPLLKGISCSLQTKSS